ncbi:MAG: PBECR2 nuclease fold domain-containing protein [Tenuifilaceae bacterium]|nr:PBECR2 nuclease fold domain-containing protein [Tenuifilaceae bacterium]
MKPTAEAVPFQEAIDHLKQKVNIPTKAWTDIWNEMHARAFVVAGATAEDLLSGFHAAILSGIEDGTTLEDFRKSFDTLVERHGWSYKGSRGWRTRTIYDTNLRQAHMTGRWRQVQAVKESFPYLRYVTLTGGRRRELHQRWRNTVLPVDHPWWDTHYPMNGWGCKCTVESLSRHQMEKRGLTVSEDPTTETETVLVKTPDGDVPVEVPKGVGPGFVYNPGKADMGRLYSQADLERLKASGEWKDWTPLTKGDWKTLGRPDQVPADKVNASLHGKVSSIEGVRKELERILGGKEKVFTLPDGSSVLVNAEILARHLPADRASFLSFLPEVLEDPFEIWMEFMRHKATGKVALRKRLVKVVELERDKALMLVAEAKGGKFVGWTFIPMGNLKKLGNVRKGALVWGR